jgi:hypothetical protein
MPPSCCEPDGDLGLDRAPLRLANEFATVDVELDTRGNGPRLKVSDRRSGHRVYLDPLELASLTTSSRDDLERLVDPARVGRAGHEERSSRARWA